MLIWNNEIVCAFIKIYAAQKMKFPIKDFLVNVSILRIWSYLLKKSLMENLECYISKRYNTAY